MFNLAASGVGAGVLSLPLVFKNSGILLGVMLLLFGMIMTIYSMRLLIYCGAEVGASTYSETCEKIVGKRLRFMFELCINIYCFGTLVAYFLIIYTYIPLIVEIFDITGFFANSTRDLILFVWVFVFPLCLLKNISALRYASLISVFAIGYVVFAIAFRTIQFYSTGDDSNTDVKPVISVFRLNADIFTSLSIVIFAFTCHVNAFSVYHELYNPTNRRMNKVISYTAGLEMFLYAFVAIFGYLHFGLDTESNILLNYSSDDVMMGVGRIMIILTLLLHCPLQVYPALKAVKTTFKIDSALALPNSMDPCHGLQVLLRVHKKRNSKQINRELKVPMKLVVSIYYTSH